MISEKASEGLFKSVPRIVDFVLGQGDGYRLAYAFLEGGKQSFLRVAVQSWGSVEFGLHRDRHGFLIGQEPLDRRADGVQQFLVDNDHRDGDGGLLPRGQFNGDGFACSEPVVVQVQLVIG